MKNTISLLELNERIKSELKNIFDASIWIHAEINELRENNGNCYLELIQKGTDETQLIAKQRAIVWASTYRMLKPYFESATETQLQAGIKIAVKCAIDFHEVYGINLTISDIDPNYTLGDMAMQRMLIIRQLTEEGVLEMNKKLPLSELPQRIAVISSETAAGYGDFMSRLTQNGYGYPFYTKLFPAIMQGNLVEKSVLTAFDQIFKHLDSFDVVVLIRGGGATSDLSGFESYRLATHLAQFPLPVICGIGHQRDYTVLDMIAHTRVNTPTAAADFLIERLLEFEIGIDRLSQRIIYSASTLLSFEQHWFESITTNISSLCTLSCKQFEQTLYNTKQRLKYASDSKLKNEKHQLEITQSTLKWSEPHTILKKGYSITTKDGKTIRSVKQLCPNQSIKTIFQDGEIESITQ